MNYNVTCTCADVHIYTYQNFFIFFFILMRNSIYEHRFKISPKVKVKDGVNISY